MGGRLVHAFTSRRSRAALLILFVAGPLLASAQNVSISALIEEPIPPTPQPAVVIFKGLAYPSSRVTIQKNAVTVATVPADPTARFEVQVGDLATGTYAFSVYSEDDAGRVSRPYNVSLFVSVGTTTTISGIFLGPTIAIEKTEYKLADTVTILGTTAPQSEVTVVVASENEQSLKTTSSATGGWVIQKIGSDFGVGTHSAKAKAVATTNEISGFSDSVSFSVAQDVSNPCAGKTPGDLNCDGKVNLTDFSILMFYWKKTNPANARADLNKDGIVTIVDLSILLYWWAP